MRRSVLLSLAIAAGVLAACGPEVMSDAHEEDVGVSSQPLWTDPPNAPRGGDPARGKDILINNGPAPLPGEQPVPYLSCGLPQGVVNVLREYFFTDVIGNGPKFPDSMRRPGQKDLPYYMTRTTRPNGVEVVTSSCLLCHASKLGGQVIIGLPNANLDFSQDPTIFGFLPFTLAAINEFLKPEEQVELQRYWRVQEAGLLAPRPDTKGVNSADVVYGMIAANRDKATLEWMEAKDPIANWNLDVVYTDVPAWWNTRNWAKKPDGSSAGPGGYRQRMFYSAVGGGSHARIMMAASLLCLENNEEAAKIDRYFNDVEAFILSLRPPRYADVAKLPIDTVRAESGRKVYYGEKEYVVPGSNPQIKKKGLPGFPGLACRSCHGDPRPGYDIPPIPFVNAEVVGTDPVFANNQAIPANGAEDEKNAIKYYFDYFNQTWYGTVGDKAIVERTGSPIYKVPSLGGIWATAPYFHNASVPTLAGVLNPALRPNLYRRTFDPELYDFGGTKTPPAPLWNGKGEIGWPYEPVLWKVSPFTGLKDTTVYDVRTLGYGNKGHVFAAQLPSTDHRDLLEFLKTL